MTDFAIKFIIGMLLGGLGCLILILGIYWFLYFKEVVEFRRTMVKNRREFLGWNDENGVGLEGCKKVLEGIIEENRGKRGANLKDMKLNVDEICVMETILKYMEAKKVYRMKFYSSDLNRMKEELGEKKEDEWKNRYVGSVLRKISKEKIKGISVKKSEDGTGRSAKGNIWIAERRK